MSNRENLLNLLLAVLVGIVFDKVFYAGFQGLGYSLLMFSLIILFFAMLGDRLKLKGNKGLFMLIPIFIMIIRSTIYDINPLHFLNVLFLPVLMTAAALIIWFRDIEYYRPNFFSELAMHIILYPLTYLGKPFIVIKNRIFTEHKENHFKTNPQVLAGILISIPLLLIVLVFLSSADMMFSYYVSNFFDSLNFLSDWEMSDTLGHLILIFAAAFYFFSFVWGFSERKELPIYSDSGFRMESLTLSIPLSLLNIIYLLFSIVQFSYLYGSGSLPDGFTYAEYARRGFFELVAITVINFAIIIIGINRTKGGSEKVNSLCRILYTFLALFTLNMLYSANYKMRLYEKTYGYTYLRVYVHLFMALLLILTLAALIAIWYRKINLSKTVILGGITFYTFLNIINVDAFIAKKNIEIYKQKGKIDLYYLTALSNDALPYLIDFIEDPTADINGIIIDDLNRRREESSLNQDNHSILKFNFSKNRAQKFLK